VESDVLCLKYAASGALILIASASAANAFDVQVDWSSTAPCFDPASPVFTLKHVPKTTQQLDFRMVDLNAPNYPHGGGVIPYKGQMRISKGAFTYKGPCPPNGVHTYRWTVTALDRSGQVVDVGTATAPFPPP
jgi:phosphatidylethanolamine-binding protein (PEBP) family uncharacterized protein